VTGFVARKPTGAKSEGFESPRKNKNNGKYRKQTLKMNGYEFLVGA